MQVLAPGDVQDLFVAFAATDLPPPRGRIDLLAAGDEIVAGSRAFAALIHVPYHVAIDIASEGERLLHGAATVSPPDPPGAPVLADRRPHPPRADERLPARHP